MQQINRPLLTYNIVLFSSLAPVAFLSLAGNYPNAATYKDLSCFLQ